MPEGREATTSENKPSTNNLSNNHHAVWHSQKGWGSVSFQFVRDGLKALGIETKNLNRWITKLAADGQIIRGGNMIFMPDNC